jgi:hypothetical protein
MCPTIASRALARVTMMEFGRQLKNFSPQRITVIAQADKMVECPDISHCRVTTQDDSGRNEVWLARKLVSDQIDPELFRLTPHLSI